MLNTVEMGACFYCVYQTYVVCYKTMIFPISYIFLQSFGTILGERSARQNKDNNFLYLGRIFEKGQWTHHRYVTRNCSFTG